MKRNNKRIITDTLYDHSPHIFEGTPEDIKRRIDEDVAEYGPNIKYSWHPDRYHAYESSPSPCYNIERQREETDIEYKDRITKEMARENEQDARDRAMYEELQKKFGAK